MTATKTTLRMDEEKADRLRVVLALQKTSLQQVFSGWLDKYLDAVEQKHGIKKP
jgi:dsDNA-binding SOS-regulon protein